MNTDDKKINPSYYTKGIPLTDYIESHDLGFCAGNIVKYVTRFLKKNPEDPLQDLKKAQKYLEMLIAKHTENDLGAKEYSDSLRLMKQGKL
ncbi:DUF3310 domain-containing protein [Candidatus Thioglobus sp.]|jgi:hypothetical protein|nr:DUF3310 domain-containing protein [Candidatus Thioglobus sp.]|tara:strand:+ start:226 stop:498 length:273 start_codon:yes stop_codon:yes gene_type:complete